MWLVIGLSVAVVLMSAFILAIMWIFGRAEKDLDDGDPNNPYHRWKGDK